MDVQSGPAARDFPILITNPIHNTIRSTGRGNPGV
jgi:hypothetical protein